MADDRIKIAVPETGRTARRFLRMLGSKEILDPEWSLAAAEAMKKSRRSGEEEAAGAVEELRGQGIGGLKATYDPGKNSYGVGFLSREAEVDGIPVVFYGRNWPQISGIREETDELAVMGLDDLTASMLPYLKPDSSRIREGFGDYGSDMGRINYEIENKNSTDVRVIGGAGLEDYAGLFVLASREDEIAPIARQYSFFHDYCRRAEGTERFARSGDKREFHRIGETFQKLLSEREVAAKGKHQGMAYEMMRKVPYEEEGSLLSKLSHRIYSLLSQGGSGSLEAKVFSAGNVKEEVREGAGRVIGLDLVRNGETLSKNGLVAIGPLMRTASVMAVDRAKLRNNEDVFQVYKGISGTNDYSDGFLRWENELLDEHERRVFMVDMGELLSSVYLPELH